MSSEAPNHALKAAWENTIKKSDISARDIDLQL